jgi:hypothetical protein
LQEYEKNISAEQYFKEENTWFLGKNGDQEWASSHKKKTGQRAQEIVGFHSCQVKVDDRP